MDFVTLYKFVRENATEPPRIVDLKDNKELHKIFYEGLREPGEVYLFSGELDPAGYNGSPQVMALNQRLRSGSGWLRYIYHSSLMMSGGNREKYFKSWDDSLENAFNFLGNSEGNEVFQTEELVNFYQNTRKELSRIKNGDLGERVIVGMYPQGEILNVLDQQDGNLRLQVYHPFVSSRDIETRKMFIDITEEQIKNWVKQNEEQFGFKLSMVCEEDIYDLVINPKDLSTVRPELKYTREAAKPGTTSFGI